jgi:hypothetical protein
MPCWTVTLIRVKLRAQNLDALKDALEAEFGVSVTRVGDALYLTPRELGYQVCIRGGEVQVRQGDEHIVRRITRAYAEQVVKRQAKRFGWTLSEVKGMAPEKKKYVATRRF